MFQNNSELFYESTSHNEPQNDTIQNSTVDLATFDKLLSYMLYFQT